MNTAFARLFRHLALLALLCCPLTVPAAVSGLWTTSQGEHLLVLQDQNSGTTFSLQLPATLDSLQVWMGSGSPASITLQGVLSPDDRLAAGIDGNRMTGTIARSGQTQTLNASLALAWVANGNAGVWQKDSAANAYLVFCVLETANGRLGVQVDVTVDVAGKSYRYDVFTGVLTGSTFVGASLTGSGYSSRLQFGSGTLEGTQSTVTRPVQSVSYRASQIVKIGS